MKGFFYLIFCCLIFVNPGFSQTGLAKENGNNYNAYDLSIIYENNDIFNGLEYVDEYRSLSVDNHKFYESYDFIKGSVVYSGQPYYNIKMKYNLLSDIVVLEFVNKKVNYLSLNSTAVHQFILNKSKFVRLLENDIIKPFFGNGFFKEAYKGEWATLYVKYIKNKIEKLDNKKVYYTFTDKEVYVLFYKNNYYKINSKKDIIKAIPEYENEILNYYKLNKRLYKKNKHQFLLNLVKNLDKNSLNNLNR